ncbi:MAG: UDP-3-O-[3-hydroxymyristoyl] N-acetylglucosamine deacetylase [Bdellovibrionaceae bacterium]|nr:UDP-3-O-[3-hydroxymyristoyl] N-acetylglucosamine deacetylase [Bdellovibrionales bacterium]MCB9255222.1 UDP-3-O-[3-hydroxymyristoyl] N-acetylglucosamine deacetylase [Pseudobdellovibrionaceae bacterium]
MQNQDYFTSPFTYRIQKTPSAPVKVSGIGLHTGVRTHVCLQPAEANSGIQFIRTDIPRAEPIPAHYNFVVATDLATTVGSHSRPDARVGTVEHLMAALFALGITNVLVEVEGPEIPILDGSAIPFVEALIETGVSVQPYSTATLKIYKPVRVRQNGAICELLPRDRLRITTSIDFPHPVIGLQTYALDLTPNAFRSNLCSARTFGFANDVERLKQQSLAQGASLQNVLAFSDDAILNPEGPRFEDECVRHKLLDAIGDLALCGCWIEGEMVSHRGGHSIHRLLLQTLNDFPTHWERLPPEPIPAPVFARSKGVSSLSTAVD